MTNLVAARARIAAITTIARKDGAAVVACAALNAVTIKTVSGAFASTAIATNAVTITIVATAISAAKADAPASTSAATKTRPIRSTARNARSAPTATVVPLVSACMGSATRWWFPPPGAIVRSSIAVTVSSVAKPMGMVWFASSVAATRIAPTVARARTDSAPVGAAPTRIALRERAAARTEAVPRTAATHHRSRLNRTSHPAVAQRSRNCLVRAVAIRRRKVAGSARQRWERRQLILPAGS